MQASTPWNGTHGTLTPTSTALAGPTTPDPVTPCRTALPTVLTQPVADRASVGPRQVVAHDATRLDLRLDGAATTFQESGPGAGLDNGAGHTANAGRWPSPVGPVCLPPSVQTALPWPDAGVTATTIGLPSRSRPARRGPNLGFSRSFRAQALVG